MEYYSAIKKNETMPFAAIWMDLEIIILSEINQKEKDKYTILYIYVCVYIYIYTHTYIYHLCMESNI